MSLKERLGKEWLFCDGGTGSLLQKLGLKGGELPETWNLSRPEDIKKSTAILPDVIKKNI